MGERHLYAGVGMARNIMGMVVMIKPIFMGESSTVLRSITADMLADASGARVEAA